MAETPPTTPPPEPVDKPLEAMTVDELATALRYHNYRYFELAAPVIDDYAFDRLTRRLRDVAPSHPALDALVGDATAQGQKVAHDSPMLSLDKAYDAETVHKWADHFEGGVVMSPKIDGVAASLRYDARGRLLMALTRGDGKRGEVFTDNARFIDDIPKDLGEGPLEIRGEIYMKLSVFAGLAGDFSNPRNTTAGAIKQKDPKKTAGYRLSFFAYSVRGREFETLMDWVAWAKAKGVAVVDSELVERDEVQAGYDRWVAARARTDYEMDGVVFTANRTSEHVRLGETAHHPRYAIAYKFQGESGETTLEQIEWSVSRSGAITPVAIVTPISLSGAMVSRCSMHNLAILAGLGASAGARVVAMRRGGVIPHIEAVVTPGPAAAVIPTSCPSCGGPTTVDGDVLFCAAPQNCTAARIGTLEHFVKAAEIDGFGPKILDQLLSLKLVTSPPDLFDLTLPQLLSLERMGTKLARKLLDGVAAARTMPLDRFLKSLGVDDLGNVASTKLAETFNSLDAVLEARHEAIAEVYGLGELTATSIMGGLEERAEMIGLLRDRITVTDVATPEVVEVDPASDDPLAGRSFVFTGKMASMDRKTAQGHVKRRGGKTPSGVSGELDYLVVGDDGSPLLGDGAMSSKHKKADKLVAGGAELKIITETAFIAMVGGLQ